MYNLLWTGEYEASWDKILSERFNLEKASLAAGGQFPMCLLKKDELTVALQGKDLFLAGYDKIDEEVIKNCPDLKMVLSVRDGPEENVDIEACTKHGIPVLYACGRCVHSVAELTLTLMFVSASHFYKLASTIRNEGWTHTNVEPETHLKTELFGKTVSIIGLGRNGKELARICNGIGMNVVASDPFVTQEKADALGLGKITMMSLDDALKAGDYVSLLARVTPETKGMIGAREIGLMKKTAVLINTARAALTDEEAIFDALENDTIAGACLDVFTKEPLPEDSRAWKIPADKLIITPHAAGLSVERTPHQYEYLFESFDKFLNGDLNEIRLHNPKVLDSPEFKDRGGKLFGVNKK